MFQIKAAVAKTNKYAVSQGGDTIEVVERPRGGISIVLADGQGSGASAKAISGMVVGKAVALIAQGARDGAVARAVHDMLHSWRNGQVSSTLVMVSVDLHTQTLVISRNGNCPVFLRQHHGWTLMDSYIDSIGFHYYMKPEIIEVPLIPKTTLVVMTDGITHAGRRYANQLAKEAWQEFIQGSTLPCPQAVANDVLQKAISLDRNRPHDDMSVLALGIENNDEPLPISTMTIELPIIKALP